MTALFVVVAAALLALVTLLLGHAALQNQGLLMRARDRARHAALVGDQHGHDGAAREIAFLRPAVLRNTLAFILAGALTVAAMLYAAHGTA